MKELAKKYHREGFSCAESVISATADKGFVPRELISVSTSFSGGMSSGCLCGAIAASQMVIGYNFGKGNSKGNDEKARILAKEFIDKFKEKRGATCCRVLTAKGRDCNNIVGECAEILEQVLCF